jgi:hypothetical protein
LIEICSAAKLGETKGKRHGMKRERKNDDLKMRKLELNIQGR